MSCNVITYNYRERHGLFRTLVYNHMFLFLFKGSSQCLTSNDTLSKDLSPGVHNMFVRNIVILLFVLSHLVCPISGEHINGIENKWSLLKRWLRFNGWLPILNTSWMKKFCISSNSEQTRLRDHLRKSSG